jgi:hypothetical protein
MRRPQRGELRETGLQGPHQRQVRERVELLRDVSGREVPLDRGGVLKGIVEPVGRDVRVRRLRHQPEPRLAAGELRVDQAGRRRRRSR